MNIHASSGVIRGIPVKACVQDKIGQLSKGCLDKLLDSMAGGSVKVCKNQTYALCAAVRCNVYNGVACCQCDVKRGDSISLPFTDVCSTNAAGADNKYMNSTYSLPDQIVSPQGSSAVYTCPAGGSGAYAQCDGGICFRSTEETTFPGFDKPLPKGKTLRQVFLPVLQRRHCKQQHGYLCRRTGWRGSRTGSLAQRQCPAYQRVPGVVKLINTSWGAPYPWARSECR